MNLQCLPLCSSANFWKGIHAYLDGTYFLLNSKNLNANIFVIAFFVLQVVVTAIVGVEVNRPITNDWRYVGTVINLSNLFPQS
jgi:hypothetical protein